MSIRKTFTLLALGVLALLLLSCATPKPAAVQPETKTVPDIVSPAGAKTGWEARWDKTLIEARREGRINLAGPPGAEIRIGFTEMFQKRYPGIFLEYSGARSAEVLARMSAERRAGLYTVDLHLGGTTTILTSMRDMLQPIKPFLILPEVANPDAWMEGKMDFADNAGELNLVFSILANSGVAFNTNLVKQSEITSFWDLARPQYKDKMVMYDPRISGSGLANATFWYYHPELGLDFIKALAKNNPLLSRDARLNAEGVARGKYYMTLAPGPTEVAEMQRLGLPIKFSTLLKEGTYSTAGFGSAVMMDKAPHPNAAAVFLNWMLTQEGQTVWSRATAYASRRIDVPRDHLPEANNPDPKGKYMSNYKEDMVMKKDELTPHLLEIFGR